MGFKSGFKDSGLLALIALVHKKVHPGRFLHIDVGVNTGLFSVVLGKKKEE